MNVKLVAWPMHHLEQFKNVWKRLLMAVLPKFPIFTQCILRDVGF